MSIKDFENVFTRKQMENICDNLNAYIANFEYIKIVKADYGKGFYVYTNEQQTEYGNYTQYCYCFDHLNSWLYHMVQCRQSTALYK